MGCCGSSKPKPDDNYDTKSVAESENARVSRKIHTQKNENCYAFGIATVLRSTQSRLNLQVETHESLVKYMTKKYGNNADAIKVMQEVTAERNLKLQEYNVSTVDSVLSKGRSVVAVMGFADQQFNNFCRFFNDPNNADRVLTNQDIGTKTLSLEPPPSHTFVIIGGTNQNYFKAKNSWNEDWGDDGYFRFSKNINQNVFLRMFDIYGQSETSRI